MMDKLRAYIVANYYASAGFGKGHEVSNVFHLIPIFYLWIFNNLINIDKYRYVLVFPRAPQHVIPQF